MGVRKMYKEGDMFATPTGVFGMVTKKTDKGTFVIRWDGVKDQKELTLDELKTAVDRNWISFVGGAHRELF